MLCPSQPRHLSIDTSLTASRNSAVHALWSNALAAPLMTLAHGVERRGCESRERRDPARRAAESHMGGWDGQAAIAFLCALTKPGLEGGVLAALESGEARVRFYILARDTHIWCR